MVSSGVEKTDPNSAQLSKLISRKLSRSPLRFDDRGIEPRRAERAREVHDHRAMTSQAINEVGIILSSTLCRRSVIELVKI